MERQYSAKKSQRQRWLGGGSAIAIAWPELGSPYRPRIEVEATVALPPLSICLDI
jgi:hypothetical protein